MPQVDRKSKAVINTLRDSLEWKSSPFVVVASRAWVETPRESGGRYEKRLGGGGG